MTIKPRVFVLEPYSVNISRAASYGPLTYIFQKGEQRPAIFDPRYVREIYKRLDRLRFDPEHDYFLVAAPQVPLALALSVIFGEYESVKTLLFDASESAYVTRRLGLGDYVEHNV